MTTKDKTLVAKLHTVSQSTILLPKLGHYQTGPHVQVRDGFSLEYEPRCGRYRLSRRKEVLAEHFGVGFTDVDWEPRYNIAPTQPVPVLRRDRQGTLRASLMRWGLIPSWAGDPSNRRSDY